MTEHQFNRRLLLAAFALLAALIWSRPAPPAYVGVDAGCYARIARDIAERPISAWPEVTWGEPFYEHPPGALWVESLWFRAFGFSAQSGVTLARLWATLLGLGVALVALRLSDARVAALSLVGLASFGGFYSESQNPMLDLPLTTVMTFAILAIVSERSGWFAVLFTFAFFIKGPPALALLAPLMWFAATFRRLRFAAMTVALALALLSLACLCFEYARLQRGLAPFFSIYFERQLKASLLHGHHNPSDNPFFYLTTVAGLYSVFVVALPLGAYLRRREPLWQLGALWAAAIVGGFTLARQKYAWYIHPMMPGAAWVTGLALATVASRVPLRLLRWLPRVLGTAAAFWFALSVTTTFPLSRIAHSSAVMDRTAWPSPSPDRIVADCSDLGEWRAKHLFSLYWRAERRACNDSSAAWVFDGDSLRLQAK